jgi:hypothetical protein
MNKISIDMKKLLYILPLLFLTCSCDMFEMDNYKGPDASITGNIIDVKTKTNVPTECKYGNFFGGAYLGAPTEGYFSVFEKGWDYEQAQYWHIKYDGSYSNTKIFSGKYRIEANSDNFYPVIKDEIEFKKGENTLDWEVIPYARVIDPVIEYKNGKFVASFKCEFGDDTKANKIVNAKLLCYPDAFVGIYCNYCGQDPGATSTNIVADGKTVNTLSIDPKLPVNQAEFKYEGKDHFLRIAVCANGANFNTGCHYNYCPTVMIKL